MALITTILLLGGLPVARQVEKWAFFFIWPQVANWVAVQTHAFCAAEKTEGTILLIAEAHRVNAYRASYLYLKFDMITVSKLSFSSSSSSYFYFFYFFFFNFFLFPHLLL